MKKYFFIDYDNTLFSHRTRAIPSSALEALKRLKEDGHKVLIASGRCFRSDAPEFGEIGLTPDGLVSSNGALVEVDGKLLHEVYFDLKLQNRLIDYIQEKNYCLMGRYNGLWYTTNLGRLQKRVSDAELGEFPLYGEAFNDLRDKPMLSFFLEDTDEAALDLENHFPDLKILRMGSEFGGSDVIPRENGKANGMVRILEYFGASLADAVAIGDSMNDIEMLQKAGLGIAMGNAMQEVRDAADYVARDIDDDGFLDAVSYALRQ